ncbi:MAG: CDP-glycerol glycerophosphotransferase family protein [Bacteroidaceae bacterium]|nr:CDP-glycerol glycerophosphotransferase family protein [Bacteroidaceae bacterium]
MKICLFCEHKYAVSILEPIQVAADKEGGNDVLWYVDARHIPEFPLKDKVTFTNSISDIYSFSPEASFCPGNIMPYYLPGVKIEIFHGYASEKKDHWVIRRYFDTYFTQGPYFTQGFERLAKKYKDFEVLETGWPRQDWIFANLHTFDTDRNQYLTQYGKSHIVLYAPTFSPSLTSLPFMRESLRTFARKEDVVVLLKFHPLTAQKYLDEYRQLADEEENIVWIDDFNVTKYMLMSDVMISDTSSTIYEFLLLDKPVITLRAVAKTQYWRNMQHPEELCTAYHDVLHDDKYTELRQWVINNYDPYLDGRVGERMLEGARDYIRRHGVPKCRHLNLWRVYTSIKTFGFPPSHKTCSTK